MRNVMWVAIAGLTMSSAVLRGEQGTAQQLFERGAYAEVADRVGAERNAGNDDPTTTYLAGQALLKLDRAQDARGEFARLSNGNDETWRAIGQSAIALIDNALDEAVSEGRRARDAGGESGFAFYQLGLAHLRRNEFDAAAQALDRAAELIPEFAYAYYNAGVAHQRSRRLNQMAERFQAFLKLAPDAPERKQVQLALSALKG